MRARVLAAWGTNSRRTTGGQGILMSTQPGLRPVAAWSLAGGHATPVKPAPARLTAAGLAPARRGAPRLALALLALAASATTLAAAPPAESTLRLGTTATFASDLRACQNSAGGRLDQRRRFKPSQPRVAACLRQRGGNADGSPSLDRLLAPAPG